MTSYKKLPFYSGPKDYYLDHPLALLFPNLLFGPASSSSFSPARYGFRQSSNIPFTNETFFCVQRFEEMKIFQKRANFMHVHSPFPSSLFLSGATICGHSGVDGRGRRKQGRTSFEKIAREVNPFLEKKCRNN